MMNSIPMLENKILHNSIDERQFIRATLPAKLQILSDDCSDWYELNEISLGGCSFQAENTFLKLKVGFIAEAHFKFSLGVATIELDIPICIVASKGNRISASFYDLKGEKREAVRYIIGAYLSGEACLFWPFMDTHTRLI